MIHRHPYRYLFYSGIANGVGDRFSQVAVLTLILQLTGAGPAVELLRVYVSFLICCPLAGPSHW
ncbi:hypothetical protein [Halobacillus litoralis]|uniref:Major facilitator superfamily (MFS) profile domain-containing protein n=1 Tax=Halobacillus litoralis TaxID=45668 RepID=A0A410M9I4_9BACI|nr:hypothetical protein [Halobacillus litoralis]QAS51347.1 hypothetical protein HLI_03520 [Halobacillus litoralis]